jgi:hypothetical protein
MLGYGWLDLEIKLGTVIPALPVPPFNSWNSTSKKQAMEKIIRS